VQDVLHDLELICCASVIEAGGPQPSYEHTQHATHALGRLIDLLQARAFRVLLVARAFCTHRQLVLPAQSLWTLTSPDVCETLEGDADFCCCLFSCLHVAVFAGLSHICTELDDRIIQICSLFESEILQIFNAM
jgi:hypothetical protein